MRDLDPIILEARIYRLEQEGGSSEELEKLKKYVEDLKSYEVGKEVEVGTYFGEKLYRQCFKIPVTDFVVDNNKTKHFNLKELIDNCKNIVNTDISYPTNLYGYVRSPISFINSSASNQGAIYTTQYYSNIMIRTFDQTPLDTLITGAEFIYVVAYYTKEEV